MHCKDWNFFSVQSWLCLTITHNCVISLSHSEHLFCAAYILSWWYCIIMVKWWMYSYRFFSIHCLHPQPPVGLWESLQGDDAMSAEREKSSYPSTIQQQSYWNKCIPQIVMLYLNTHSQSSFALTSPPLQCQSRSVCRLNPSSFWHTSAGWTYPV